MSGASRRRRQKSQIDLKEMAESDELVRPLRRNYKSIEENVSRTLKFYDLNLGDVWADEATIEMTKKIYGLHIKSPPSKAIKEKIE